MASLFQVKLHANNRDLVFPRQLFINNEFIDSLSGRTYATINPTDETEICQVSKASAEDVDLAVHYASVSFEQKGFVHVKSLPVSALDSLYICKSTVPVLSKIYQ